MGRIFYDTFDPIGIEDARTFVTGNEGNKPWMYGDGGGNVTIGFGHLVENLGEALEINFVNKHTSAPATDLEIAHDFEAAEAGTSAYAPDYEEDALLHLATGEDSRLFGADFPVHLKIADEFFPLEDLPTEVQVALFDLAFQVGGGGIGGDPRGLSTAEQNRSKGRRKTGPFSVMRYAVLRVVPLVHRRAPRCFA